MTVLNRLRGNPPPCDRAALRITIVNDGGLGTLISSGSLRLNRSPLARALLASAALAAALALAGCETDDTDPALPRKRRSPSRPRRWRRWRSKNMAKESPILVRLFKQESELEVWKKDSSGQLGAAQDLSRSAAGRAISDRRSGKATARRRRASTPSRPGLMNPASQYHLAFNIGFPNAFDRAHGRTGAI